jgi:hypothetical protein
MQRLFLAAALAVLTASTSPADQGTTPRSGAIRVVCLFEWDAEIFAKGRLPAPLPNARFDVLVPLSAIPAEATASEALAYAERQTGNRRSDFTGRVQYLRWRDGPDRYIRWGSSTLHKSSLSLMRDVEDGDILVFHAIVCRF